MTKHIIPSRPARAAIAAVLAFGTAPLMAQTVDAPVQPTTPPVSVAPVVPAPMPQVTPPTVATPSAPVAATPAPPSTGQAPIIQMKPSAPVVQAVPPAPVVAAEPEATPEPAAPPVRAEKRVARESAPAPAAPVERAEAPAPAAPAVTAEPAPVVPVYDEATPAMQETAPVANDQAVTVPDNSLEYGLIAAGAIAVLGLGGVMLLRRRRRHDDADAVVYETAPIAAAPTGVAAAPAVARTPEPEDSVAASAFPQFAQMQGMPQEEVAHGSLEAAAAAAPSKANPFLTRKNRLRRAHFLMQQGAETTPTASAPSAAVETARSIPVETQEARTQVVHNFGKQPNIRFRFKPSTT